MAVLLVFISSDFYAGRFWLDHPATTGILASLATVLVSVTVIEVADTGPGVPERARAHLFKAFQSVARKGGTGLGLAIAAELVQAHGGNLTLLDTECGAIFRVTIPDLVVELDHARRLSA